MIDSDSVIVLITLSTLKYSRRQVLDMTEDEPPVEQQYSAPSTPSAGAAASTASVAGVSAAGQQQQDQQHSSPAGALPTIGRGIIRTMVVLQIKWKSEMHAVEVSDPVSLSIEELKHELFSLTEVLPERQKLLAKGKTLKNEDSVQKCVELIVGKATGKAVAPPLGNKPPTQSAQGSSPGAAQGNGTTTTPPAPDCGQVATAPSSDCGHPPASPPPQKPLTIQIMMLGSTEKDLEYILEPPEMDDNIQNDFDDDEPGGPFVISDNDMCKIEKRVQLGADVIDVCSPPDPTKKLLMLDIDYTFFDHRTPAENALQLKRPFLDEFLTAAFTRYNIGIWSATSRRWIDLKLQELGVMRYQNYEHGSPVPWRVSIIMDARAMVSTNSVKYGGVVRVKPLEVLWRFAQQNG